jgi:protease-4
MAWSRKRKALIVVFSLIVLMFFVSLFKGLAGRGQEQRIAVIEIEGIISDSKDVMEDINRFKEDELITGVILRIDSPGGAVGPTQEIYREVIKLKDKKNVFVSMGTACASGGYYIASAAEKIYANPSTITGSIGVIMQLMIAEDVLKKLGLESNTVKAGKFKDVGSPFRRMTGPERAYLDEIVTSIHEQFIKDIAAGRKMDVATVRKLAQGKIYTGTQAQEVGLIDSIGNFYDTVDGLKEVLEIEGKPVLVYAQKRFSLMRWLFSSLAQELINGVHSTPFKYLMVP